MYDKIKNDIEVVNHKDEIISLYTPSSITPGENPIYMIVNILAQREYQNMNGHCLSRLELDLDYQPRIIYENILISRERWRISKKELDFIDNSESINKQADSFIQFANLLVEKKIPTNFFIYTDSYFKPSFIKVSDLVDFTIIKAIVLSAKKYVYIEEFLPNEESSISNRNVEVCQIL